MSLTSILTDRKNQILRNEFKSNFVRPEFTLQTHLKAPPLTNNFGMVGTAFDYLMRFFVQHHNSATCVQNEDWIATYSYEILVDKILKNGTASVFGVQNDGMADGMNSIQEDIEKQYLQAKNNFNKYVENGILTDELISSTIFLAKLDVYYRTGEVRQILDPTAPEDISDIKQIYSFVDKDNFKSNHKCFLNPTFGEASKLVGGADADLIIDDTLIDIKTVRHLEIQRKYLNQILGYYLLSLIGGVNDDPNYKPIEKIGLYFARHGELWTVPVKQFGDKVKFDKFKDWFLRYISENITITQF